MAPGSASFVPEARARSPRSFSPAVFNELTLRRTLLLAFVILGLLPSVALSWLSFSRTRDAMTAQIRAGLAVQARALQTDLDAMLFERFQNALVWRRAELLDDLRLGDVDKRVSQYLVGLQNGYGEVYRSIDCRTAGGLVLASSTAGRIGRTMDDARDGEDSVTARLGGGEARLALLRSPTLDDRLPMVIETDIPSGYARPGGVPDLLHLEFDARQVSRLLDAAAIGRRLIVVVDAQGRWVAGSAGLRGRPRPDAVGRALARALAAGGSTAPDGAVPTLAGTALVGRATSQGSAIFAGSGWTTLIFEPVDAALVPVREMGIIFAGLLLAVLLATLAAASWLAARLARPLVALTARTRRFQSGAGAVAADEVPEPSRIAELDELGRAFGDMVRALEQQRRELVRASKMAMLGELGSVLAHEVRTPLGILRSSAQILMRNPDLGEQGRELMAFIQSETDRLNRLVSTMLDTARPRQPSLAPCDVHDLLRRCAQMHDLRRGEAGAAHPVLLELRARDPVAEVDAEQLTGAVFNLLSNASQAAGPAGRVALETFDDGPDRLGLRCADDGQGIPEGLAETIFDPFVTGREGGIGLGLAVVRQVVAGHGGDIAAGRSQWGGAAFTIHLPRRQGPAAKEAG